MTDRPIQRLPQTVLITVISIVLIATSCGSESPNPTSLPARNCSYTTNQIKQLISELVCDSTEIVFIGNSLVSRGNWHTLLNNHRVVNWGIGGDELPCIRERARMLSETRSEYWIVEAGINDLQIYSRDTILQCFRDIIHIAQATGARPFVTSIVSVSQNAGSHQNGREEYREVNKLVEAYNQLLWKLSREENAEYIWLNHALIDTAGNLENSFTTDGVHLSSEAYDIWADSIKTKLHL